MVALRWEKAGVLGGEGRVLGGRRDCEGEGRGLCGEGLAHSGAVGCTGVERTQAGRVSCLFLRAWWGHWSPGGGREPDLRVLTALSAVLR